MHGVTTNFLAVLRCLELAFCPRAAPIYYSLALRRYSLRYLEGGYVLM